MMAVPAEAAAWPDAVAGKLRAGQTMPRSAIVRGATCVAKVRLSVDGNGLITRYAIVKPCAEPILTRSTDDLFFKIGQVPAPPTRRPADLEVDVRWPPQG